MPKIVVQKKILLLLFTFLLIPPFLSTFLCFAQTKDSSEARRNEILALLKRKSQSVKTLEATLKIGIPHPTAPLVQWSESLLAWQAEPEFLYVKGYKSLVPLYFLLKSKEGEFWLYLARQYTIFHGKNEVLEREIDIDLKLRPQDIIAGLRFPDLGSDDKVERLLSFEDKPIRGGYQLILKRQNGNVVRRINFDSNNNPIQVIEHNELGFPVLEITNDDWRMVGNVSFPFSIKIKRLLPRPSALILQIKELRPNARLEPKIFSNQFPQDAKNVELK